MCVRVIDAYIFKTPCAKCATQTVRQTGKKPKRKIDGENQSDGADNAAFAAF